MSSFESNWDVHMPAVLRLLTSVKEPVGLMFYHVPPRICLQFRSVLLCLLGAIVCFLHGDLSLTRLALLLQRRLPFLYRLLCSWSPRYLWLALLLGPPLRGLLFSLYFDLPLLLGLSLHSGLSLLFIAFGGLSLSISLHLLFQSRLLGRVLVLRQASSQVGIFGHFTYEERRGRESNPRIAVLQTATLPLGYPADLRERTISLSLRLYQLAKVFGVKRRA